MMKHHIYLWHILVVEMLMANSGKLLLKANVNTKKGLLNDTFLDILLQKGEKLYINVRLICDIIK